MIESMTAPNPFDGHELRNPRLPADAAAAIARERFGLDLSEPPRALGSHQDQNFLVSATTGQAVLRIANNAFTTAELELQNAAMLHLAAAAPFAVQQPLAALDGTFVVHEHGHDVRLTTFIAGEPLTDQRYFAPPILEAIGALAGGTAAGLADFTHATAIRSIQWDVRQAADVVAALAPGVVDPARRDLVERTMERAAVTLGRLDAELRRQVIHSDIMPYNLIGERDGDGRLRPVGLIDFGDVVHSWLAAEAAIAAGSVLDREGFGLPQVARVVAAFHRTCPLLVSEVDALHAMITARGAALAVSTDQQARLEPDNPHAQAALAGDWAILAASAALPEPVATAAFRQACGIDVTPVPVPRGRAPVAGCDAAPTVDLSVTTELLADRAWEDAAAVAAAVGPFALGRYGEGRLVHADRDAPAAPPSVHLGADVFAPVGTAVHAPLAGTVVATRAAELVLDCGALTVRLAGIVPAASGTVEPGDLVGTIGPGEGILPSHLHVQAGPPGLHELPGLARPAEAAAWLAVCPDVSPLLGVAVAAPPPAAATALAARRAHVAAVQETYYAEPPQIERGHRQHLYDTTGRAYLDVVNNVAILGHAHPAVTAAATRQLRLLNTNSRFLYDAISRFAERLVALAPAGLDRVLLVSSGSEANDLALRLARTATGARDVLCVHGAYHGWTQATLDVSTAVADNPDGLANLPDYVHLVASPNAYRGAFGADADGYVADVRATIERLGAEGRRLAAFIAEPLYGNAGGVPLPDGYLTGVYDLVRAAGGICIADEVQVGYGRLGSWFWAFEQQGVVPDIITVAKATGNGHPVAAVITTAAIADAFDRDASFFSSVGGSPVSCAIGLAVLDAIAVEGVQENARVVGAHFRMRLERLVERFPLAGAAHGLGLYLGLELVRDRTTKEPATAEAYAICERLLELGVIVQPTGDHLNVLKLKPPLCFMAADADRVADALERVLEEGW